MTEQGSATTRSSPPSRLVTGILVAAFLFVGVMLVLNPAGKGPPEDPEKLAAAMRDLVALEAAAAAYTRDHRAFPVTLEALVPRYLPRLPVDPHGRPYEPHANGATLYIWFVGADGELRRYPPDVCAVLSMDEAMR
jgi:hypothetical protein